MKSLWEMGFGTINVEEIIGWRQPTVVSGTFKRPKYSTLIGF